MSPKLSPKDWPFEVRFYSNEGMEEPHVHFVRAGGAEGNGKFWLKTLEFEYLDNFKKPHEKMAKKAARRFAESWLKAWEKFFEGAGK